jgi:hypothetical protein
MTSESESVAIEHLGNLMNQVAIKDSLNGCRLKLKLKSGRVVIRVLHSPSVQWSFNAQAILPGAPLPKSNKPTLLFFPTLSNGLFQAEVPIILTYSLPLMVSVRMKTIVGDLVESHTQLRLRAGASKANRWLIKQVLSSMGPVVWQIARYDLLALVRDWLIWFLPWYSPVSERVKPASSGTVKFSARAAL